MTNKKLIGAFGALIFLSGIIIAAISIAVLVYITLGIYPTLVVISIQLMAIGVILMIESDN